MIQVVVSKLNSALIIFMDLLLPCEGMRQIPLNNPIQSWNLVILNSGDISCSFKPEFCDFLGSEGFSLRMFGSLTIELNCWPSTTVSLHKFVFSLVARLTEGFQSFYFWISLFFCTFLQDVSICVIHGKKPNQCFTNMSFYSSLWQWIIFHHLSNSSCKSNMMHPPLSLREQISRSNF